MAISQPKGPRSSIEIIADILRFLRLGETGRTEIKSTVKMSSEQASNYLNWLRETGLLEEVEKEIGIPSYRITRTGLDLLSKIENMRELLPPKDSVDILHRSRLIEVIEAIGLEEPAAEPSELEEK
jgi:predicted transcriptional regulator